MRSRSRRTPAGIPVTMTVSCGPCDSPALTKRKRDMGVDLIARAAAKEAPLRPPTKENRPGGLRRAGAAGSAGWPSLNARLSSESPVSRPHVLRQALPAVPARRRPPRRLSLGRWKACCLARQLQAVLRRQVVLDLLSLVVRQDAAIDEHLGDVAEPRLVVHRAAAADVELVEARAVVD